METVKNIIISPHTDDAIFSLGAMIPAMRDVLIITPLAAIPDDEAGSKKHKLLNKEHKQVCDFMGVNFINGEFLDDVYQHRDLSGLANWFKGILNQSPDSRIFVPLGIHHPDHVIVRDLFIRHFRIDVLYEELPYRVRYPYLYENLKYHFCKHRIEATHQATQNKRKAVSLYASQVDESVMNDVMVEERIWK